jgi:hypothetical protein
VINNFLREAILHVINDSLCMLIDWVSMGACVRSIKSHMSKVPSDLAIKNTPGLVGDHSASVKRLLNDFV